MNFTHKIIKLLDNLFNILTFYYFSSFIKLH